jgi:hypothetical protein
LDKFSVSSIAEFSEQLGVTEIAGCRIIPAATERDRADEAGFSQQAVRDLTPAVAMIYN